MVKAPLIDIHQNKGGGAGFQWLPDKQIQKSTRIFNVCSIIKCKIQNERTIPKLHIQVIYISVISALHTV